MSEDRSKALEEAAKCVEALHGNLIYKRAWRKAAKSIRKLKSLTDRTGQISSIPVRPDNACDIAR